MGTAFAAYLYIRTGQNAANERRRPSSVCMLEWGMTPDRLVVAPPAVLRPPIPEHPARPSMPVGGQNSCVDLEASSPWQEREAGREEHGGRGRRGCAAAGPEAGQFKTAPSPRLFLRDRNFAGFRHTMTLQVQCTNLYVSASG
jgi:hypothetical protein